MEANITLKTIFCRKLKNGNYVILAADSEPLVVEEEFATCISQDGNALANFDESVISVFKDSGFFADAFIGYSYSGKNRQGKSGICYDREYL